MIFKNGSTTLGTKSLSGGQAVFSTTSLPAGTYAITASYVGDNNFSASSGNVNETIIAPRASVTTLTASSNTSTLGQSVTFTVTVRGSSSGTPTGLLVPRIPVAPVLNSTTPTGTVTFKDGNTVLDTKLLSGGQATFTTAALVAGSNTITASYSGDNNFSA